MGYAISSVKQSLALESFVNTLNALIVSRLWEDICIQGKLYVLLLERAEYNCLISLEKGDN